MTTSQKHCVTYYKYDSEDENPQSLTAKITIECKHYDTFIKIIGEIEKVLDEENSITEGL